MAWTTGDVVADGLTTNDSGEVTLNNVPLGSYVVEETQAPAGFVLSGEKHTVKLEYAGQDAEVAFNETTFTKVAKSKSSIWPEPSALSARTTLP